MDSWWIDEWMDRWVGRWVNGWMDEWMNARKPLPCLKHFSYPPFKSAETPPPTGSLLWHSWWNSPPSCVPVLCNSAAASIAFTLCYCVHSYWPYGSVFPEIQDQSCSSLYLSLGVVSWTWEVLDKDSQNWFLYIVQVILTLDSDPSSKHDVTAEERQARETLCHFHPCPFTASLSLKLLSHPKSFSLPSLL